MYYYVVTSVYDNGDLESVYSSVASATPMSTVVFTIGEDGVMSGSDVTLAIEMTNTEAVAGVQFDLVDNPDYMTIMSVEGTERVPGDWTLSVAEQGSGAGRLLGFSFSGTTIQPGDGPTFFVTFSTSVVPEPTTVSLCTAEEAISSSQGVAFFTDTECGSVVLDVEGIDVALITDSGPLDQGVSSEMTVVMSTPSDVYGVELHITDTPESVTALDVQAGPLVSDLNGTISFSEVNGEIIALWFSLTGDYIPAGSEGDLFVIDYVVDEFRKKEGIDLSNLCIGMV